MNSRIALALACGLVLLVVAPVAKGGQGTYSVVACDAAGGPNRSWSAQGGTAGLFVLRQRCPALGQFDGFGTRSTTLALRAAQLSGAWWRFEAPQGTSISSIEWAGQYATRSAGWSARIESSRGVLTGCGPSSATCERRWPHGARPLRFDLGGAGWVRVGALCLAATGCRTGDGRTTAYVDVSTWFARIVVRDPSAPRLTLVGDAVGERWVQPGSALEVDASDASGVSAITLEVDGKEVASRRFECDDTRPRPCLDRATRFELPTAIAEGRHGVTVAAFDAAGNRTERAFEVGIDGAAPIAAEPPIVAGGSGWRAKTAFTLELPRPRADDGSPITFATLRVCPSRVLGGSPPCLPDRRIAVTEGEPKSVDVEVPIDGEWTATVAFEDSVGNVDWALSSPSALLRSDRSRPGAGTIEAPDRWLTRAAANALSIRVRPDREAGLPLSGIAGWAVARGAAPGEAIDLDGEEAEVPLVGIAEGITDFSFRAIGGSGLASRLVASARVRVDGTPPVLAFSGLPAGPWANSPVTVEARGRDQADLSGMATGEGSSAAVRMSVDGAAFDAQAGDSNSVLIEADGVHAVTAEAIDAAGNSSGRHSTTVRIDSTPPERLAFLPRDDSDPRTVRVDVLDSGSGVAAVKLRMRRVAGGDWVDVPGSLKGERYEATLDESRLAAGLWEMEATATDAAGNQRTAGRTLDGDPAVVVLPLRVATRIEGGLAGSGQSSSASGSASMTVRHGSGAVVAGTLLDSSERPLARALLSLVTAPLMAGGSWSVGPSAMTDGAGRFAFRLPAGPGRRVRVSFEGDHRALPSSRSMTLRVPASTSLRVAPSTVRVGRVAVFSGRLAGGMIPSGGKLVTLQALIPKRGWQTFALARAGASGSWSTRYRFRASVGRAGYSIRAVVPHESGYPFDSSTSRPVRVVAIG